MAAVSVLLISPFAFQGSAPGWARTHSGDSGAQRSDSPRVAGADHCPHARKGLRFYTKRAREWRERMGAGSESSSVPLVRSRDRACPHLRRLAAAAKLKSWAARLEFEHWFSRTLEKWRCIHEHEGAWDASTGNGYWGGLQFSDWFQRHYGPEFYARFGTADRWPIFAQLVAAERAWRECRCFSQWGTASRCGLQ